MSVTIFGGFAPFVATWLIASTGNPLSPSFYLMASALLSVVSLLAIQRRGAGAGEIPRGVTGLVDSRSE
jgi:MHS family proline/betaine transporter-like MFS transporter